MTRGSSILAAVLVIAAAVLVFGVIKAVVDNEQPTQAEAEEKFCDDVGAFVAAVGALRDVDRSTPIDEFEKRRDNVRITYQNMINSGQQVREIRLDDLEKAQNNLREAVDDIDSEASLQQGLSSVKDEAEEVSKQLSEVLNDVNCGTGQGSESKSDE